MDQGKPLPEGDAKASPLDPGGGEAAQKSIMVLTPRSQNNSRISPNSPRTQDSPSLWPLWGPSPPTTHLGLPSLTPH